MALRTISLMMSLSRSSLHSLFLGDKHHNRIVIVLQSPYIKKRVTEIVSSTPASVSMISNEDVLRLRDRLASLFTEQQPILPLGLPLAAPALPMPLWPFLTKFFYTSKKRRIQPGLRTFLTLVFSIWFILAFLIIAWSTFTAGFPAFPFFFPSLFVVFLFSLLVGLYHHLRMQHLFVRLRLPRKGNVYGTISQSIIIVRRDHTAQYFYRNTQGGTIMPWEEATVSF